MQVWHWKAPNNAKCDDHRVRPQWIISRNRPCPGGYRRTTGRRGLWPRPLRGFNRTLNHSLTRVQLSPSVRRGADSRSKLAGAQIREPLIMRAFDEAFISGFRNVIWISVGVALLSAVGASDDPIEEAQCERQESTQQSGRLNDLPINLCIEVGCKIARTVVGNAGA